MTVRRFVTVILVVLLTPGAPRGARAESQPTTAPPTTVETAFQQVPLFGGQAECLAIDPDQPSVLYAGTWKGGIFRSSDSGATWTSSSEGVTDSRVVDIAIDPVTPTVLYAGTYGGAVFRSDDGGATWAPRSTGLTLAAVGVQGIVIDPLAPSTVYAATWSGVFKTVNGGTSWTPASTGLTETRVYCITMDPATPTTLYVGTFNGGGSSAPTIVARRGFPLRSG
jgi:photosystem II stability/assembly factor-like uncharacterized protein